MELPPVQDQPPASQSPSSLEARVAPTSAVVHTEPLGWSPETTELVSCCCCTMLGWEWVGRRLLSPVLNYSKGGFWSFLIRFHQLI